MIVLYASETGNTEEVAYDVQDKLQYPCRVMSIKDYDVTDLPTEKLIVFIVSTTGDGEPPEPMKPFWKFLLRKGLSSDALCDTSFALFGLGDSSYEKYNAVARKLLKRLCMLGAKEAVSTGYGDDQAPFGYLSAYFPWLESLKSYIRNTAAVAGAEERENSMQSYTIDVAGDNSAPTYAIVVTVDAAPYMTMRVASNRRQTAEVWPQDVRHIRLDIDPSNTDSLSELYRAGDVAIIPYENPSALVEQAAALIIEGSKLHGELELAMDTVLNVTCQTPPGVLPRPSRVPSLHGCSLRTLLTRHLDIGAVPKRSYFTALARYASDPEEAEKLHELASPQGTDLYFDYCARERKTYVEVLQEFRSCRPPLAALLAAVPVIAPRKYSIASAPRLLPRSVELCVAVSVRRTPYGRKRVGLCSGYLAQLQVGDAVRVAIQRGAIHGTAIERAALPLPTSEATGTGSPEATALPPPPPANATPLILIGPGTGVAPMRALIAQHCAGAPSTAEVLVPPQSEVVAPKVLLFFGCRKAQRDNLFGDEWAALNTDTNPYLSATAGASSEQRRLEAGSVRVVSAFSQDQDVKEYVTHRILANAETAWAMLQAGAAVFVAGSAKKMPADVRKALSSVLQRCGHMSEAEAEHFLGKLAAAKKYVAEGWS